MNPNNTSGPTSASKPKTLTIILSVLLLISLVANVVIYVSQSGNSSSSSKVAAAVAAAKTAQAAADKAANDKANSAPYKTFTGSATYGSVSFSYPKTYSAYVDTTGSDIPINAYFYPDQVPATGANQSYALRLELVSTPYADVLSGFQSDISSGATKATSYLPPKMQSVTNATAGMLLTGPISSENPSAKGTLVILKVRDKTLKLYTESTSFNGDFNNIVLPSLTFAP